MSEPLKLPRRASLSSRWALTLHWMEDHTKANEPQGYVICLVSPDREHHPIQGIEDQDEAIDEFEGLVERGEA